MSTTSNRTPGSLLDIEHGELTHSSTKKVPYTITHGWDLISSHTCDVLWQNSWTELIQLIQKVEPDRNKQLDILAATISTEDFHWRWFDKAAVLNTNEYEWFHLHAEGKPQGTCVIYHPQASALDPGNIFYVKFVAVAPWNRECALRPREFKGLGGVILRAAQRYAVAELNLRPGFCLHSLPKAEHFYTKLNMVKVDGKEDAQSLAYYELPEALANQLIKTI